MNEKTEETAEPVPTIERWVFGGSRVFNKKRAHGWIDPAGKELLYDAKGTYAIGSVYEARVVQQEDRTTLVGRPSYTGDRAESDELRGELAARHRAAELALDLSARERADKRDDPLEAAIGRLVELAKKVPHAQRTAFATYVALRVTRSAW